MEQRLYYGPIDPDALADYLVSVFNSPSQYTPPRSMAQKIVQGERISVQIMRSDDWGFHEHGALGLHILRIAGGVSVSMGSSDWQQLDEGSLVGMLFGALFFPPLLLFPLIHGLTSSTFPQDVWSAIENYCAQASPRSSSGGAPRGFYCAYCGAFNHPEATRCHACHAPFNRAPSQAQEPSSRKVDAQPVQPVSPPPARSSAPQERTSQSTASATGDLSLVICPHCNALVMPTNFCGNCAAPLHETSGG